MHWQADCLRVDNWLLNSVPLKESRHKFEVRAALPTRHQRRIDMRTHRLLAQQLQGATGLLG